MGDGTGVNSSSPVLVTGITTASSVFAKYDRSCAILADNSIKCWGTNTYGELGDGTTTDRTSPVTVGGTNTNPIAITSGQYHTCALSSGGTIKCWGYNGWGQLGDGTGTNRTTPTAVSTITNAVSIVAGQNHTCAVLSTGDVKCWGKNDYGQLGDGTLISSITPSALPV